MPIYEYRCPDCGHQFDIIQKFSDDPIRDCPSCEKQNVKKLLSAPAFHLKGGGWYKDHYGLKSGADESPSSDSASSDSAAPSSDSAASSSSSDGAASSSDGAASSSSSDGAASSSSSSGSSSGGAE